MPGRSGNRTGYKIFSINTTVRNPQRNTEFLLLLKPYDGKEFTPLIAQQYYFDLVCHGVYRLSYISDAVKEKIDNSETLTDKETYEAIANNPQATGLIGRVKTQLRALKDQGFLSFTPTGRGRHKIDITELGNDLINEDIDATSVYTKAMIGLHANSPIRRTLLNKARPFLNTLFVIDEVKREWGVLGFDAKGILFHEFATFVLSMKDCDYKRAAQEIINYRKRNRYEVNEKEINEYLKSQDILPLAMSSILHDYPDDVFRKFEMTGLVSKRGQFNYVYVDFSKYNLEKVNCILNENRDYKFREFNNQDEYYAYIFNISIPWQKSEIVRKKIIEYKANLLNFKFDKPLAISEQEAILDNIFYRNAIEKQLEKHEIDSIYKELLILSGTVKEDSKLHEISEPLRLEYLLALLIGKRYGTKGLVSNIIYSEDGTPLHFAPAKKCDIIFMNEQGAFILEPTMQKGRSQILNNETTNVARHVEEESESTGIQFRAMMIAPYIHTDVVDFFRYRVKTHPTKLIPISIDRTVGLFYYSNTVKELCSNFDTILSDLIEKDESSYSDDINNYQVDSATYSNK